MKIMQNFGVVIDISGLYIECFFSSYDNKNIYWTSKTSNSIVKKTKQKVEF